jgi:phosphate transport system protein
MRPHTIASYDVDLKTLEGLISDMISRGEASLKDATTALLEGSGQLAQQVIAADKAIDLLQHRVEEKAIATIATRQPFAIDLREIVSTIRIANDLERIGDLAKNIAKRVIAIGVRPASLKVASSLAPLAARVLDQLVSVGGAYRRRDDRAALQVWKSDSAIDTLHTSLFRELLTYMMEDPRSIGFCAHFSSARRTLSASAIMQPTSPRPSTT